MTAAPVYLEGARAEDVGALVALEREASTHPWTPEGFAGAIRGAAGERVVVLRCADASAIGYCVWQEVADEVHVHNIAIAAGHRGVGLGSRLLAACLALARARGARKAFLDVREGNRPARALYAGLGFREAGRRRLYYAEPAEDAIVMEASL